MEQYDPRFVAGVVHFNDRDFFEAHEAWEEIWNDVQGSARRFYQGLIQVAVCLHHFGNGNTRGARKLYHSSRGYLESYLPCFGGVDVRRLLDELEDCCRGLLDSEEEIPTVQLDPDRIPEITLDA